MPTLVGLCGTCFYGKALKKPNGSYVVTEWFVLFLLPIFPIGSRRIVEARPGKWWSTTVGHYKYIPVPLYIPHIIIGYAVTLSVALYFLIGEHFHINWMGFG